MAAVQCLRQFVKERLLAASEEIFGVFEKNIVQYEEEIDRQRRLLDVAWKPEIGLQLQRIELPQQHVCKEEEVLTDQQQLCVQERNSSVDHEEPEPPQIKQEELCTSENGEHLVVKQETDSFMLTPAHGEHEDQTLNFNISVVEEQPLNHISVKSSVVPKHNSDPCLLSHNSHGAKSQNQSEGKHGNLGSRIAEPEPKKRYRKSNSTNVNNSSGIQRKTQTDEKTLMWHT